MKCHNSLGIIFIIGKLKDDGTVEGTLISGAYPYADFQRIIDGYLE